VSTILALHYVLFDGLYFLAENSTGFKEVQHEDTELPQVVTDVIDTNMPIYEYLREMRLKI